MLSTAAQKLVVGQDTTLTGVVASMVAGGPGGAVVGEGLAGAVHRHAEASAVGQDIAVQSCWRRRCRRLRSRRAAGR